MLLLLIFFCSRFQNFKTDLNIDFHRKRIYSFSHFELFQHFDQRASNAAGAVGPVRIDGDALQARQQQTDQFIVEVWGSHKKVERPRRGSNAQPADSKSVTLSIELRGQNKIYSAPILPESL